MTVNDSEADAWRQAWLSPVLHADGQQPRRFTEAMMKQALDDAERMNAAPIRDFYLSCGHMGSTMQPQSCRICRHYSDTLLGR